MKPENKRAPLLLSDGAPVRCRFWAYSDPPHSMESCETEATTKVAEPDRIGLLGWIEEHPKTIVGIEPGSPLYLCDTHLAVFRNVGAMP